MAGLKQIMGIFMTINQSLSSEQRVRWYRQRAGGQFLALQDRKDFSQNVRNENYAETGGELTSRKKSSRRDMLYNCLFYNGYLSKRLHLTAVKERILAVNDIHPVVQPISSPKISGLSNKYAIRPVEAPTSDVSALAVFPIYSQTIKRRSGPLWGF
ncbi:hypothetical protein [uncultured Oscillibacter sp.]|uniref:hypothetical protein n=1 Tax=uncultured Oscillibacter sp. TaxID=876091 RepID=UPI0025DF7313|nr:hypothetical protein [uncultured Oscillibacter sp.]